MILSDFRTEIDGTLGDADGVKESGSKKRYNFQSDSILLLQQLSNEINKLLFFFFFKMIPIDLASHHQ